MSTTSVKSNRLTATNTVFAGTTRLRGYAWVGGAAAGTVVLKDGGSGGTTMLTIDTPAGATLSGSVLLPQEGIRFATDMHATITNTAFITFFYDA
jgi:hypothetical protein